MDNSKFEILANLMIERNLILNILQTLFRDLTIKEIETNFYEVIRAKYMAKIKSIDIKLSKEGRNLLCSKCQQIIDEEEPIFSCINCGFPFHSNHLEEPSNKEENSCPNCGSFFNIQRIDGFFKIELKKIEYNYKHLHTDISRIDVRIDGKKLMLKPTEYDIKMGNKNKQIREKGKCPNCGQDINLKWRYCKKCGYLLQKVQQDEKRCKKCGTNLDPSWRFCKWCGTPISF